MSIFQPKEKGSSLLVLSEDKATKSRFGIPENFISAFITKV